MDTKTYSKPSNAARAAKAALKNPSAKSGTDFQIDKVGPDRYTFKILGAKKAKRVRPPGTKSPMKDQPMAIKLVKYLTVVGGRSVADCQEYLGKVASHTVRGMVSRLRSEGVAIEGIQQGRNKRYRVAAE